MTQKDVFIKYLNSNAKEPIRVHETDAGYDLVSTAMVTLEPLSRAVVPTGISIALPGPYIDPTTGYKMCLEAQVRPRSGLALKRGLTVLNTPGTIDSGYRGEIKVILFNSSNSSQVINVGDKVAQLVFNLVTLPNFKETDELPTSDRNEKGFGSSG